MKIGVGARKIHHSNDVAWLRLRAGLCPKLEGINITRCSRPPGTAFSSLNCPLHFFVVPSCPFICSPCPEFPFICMPFPQFPSFPFSSCDFSHLPSFPFASTLFHSCSFIPSIFIHVPCIFREGSIHFPYMLQPFCSHCPHPVHSNHSFSVRFPSHIAYNAFHPLSIHVAYIFHALSIHAPSFFYALHLIFYYVVHALSILVLHSFHPFHPCGQHPQHPLQQCLPWMQMMQAMLGMLPPRKYRSFLTTGA